MQKNLLYFLIIAIAVGFGAYQQKEQRSSLIKQVSQETGCAEGNITAHWLSGRSSYVTVTACGVQCTYIKGFLDSNGEKVSCP